MAAESNSADSSRDTPELAIGADVPPEPIDTATAGTNTITRLESEDPAARTAGIVPRDLSLEQFLLEIEIAPSLVRRVLALPEANGIGKISTQSAYDIVYASADRETIDRVLLDLKKDGLVYFRLRPYPTIRIDYPRVSYRQRAVGGIVRTSFFDAIMDNDSIHRSVLPLVNEAVKWTVDLFHLRPGDRFKLVFTEEYLDERLERVAALQAVYFELQEDAPHYAFAFDRGGKTTFYDARGHTLQRTFLKAPVQYGRISSHYNPKRIHPVVGTVRPHLGTDYAAPEGAPISALGDGVVIEARQTQYNGNYVKIKHDAVYQTQYLHLSGFSDAGRVGRRVKQGEVIGYVGQTGLATGPHVCLRFWENGQQVDFVKNNTLRRGAEDNFPLQAFVARRDSLLTLLNDIDYHSLISK